MIGPRDVSFTAMAIARMSGVNNTSETAAMVKFTARFKESDARNAANRDDRLVRVDTRESVRASKTGNDPVTIVRVSAPREAIRECED